MRECYFHLILFCFLIHVNPFSADRTYKAYTLLLRLVPHLKSLLEDPEADNEALDKFIALVFHHSTVLIVH